MKSHIKFVALIALVVAHDINTQIKARQAASLFLEASEAYQETEIANHAQIAYLIHLLEKNGIAPTEFDLIALNFAQE